MAAMLLVSLMPLFLAFLWYAFVFLAACVMIGRKRNGKA